MRQIRLLAILIAFAAAAGCSKHATDPGSGGSPPSPVLVATQPTARAAGVLYDSEIWGQFDRALDPATVSAQSAYLKLDGQRISSTVTYDDGTRRVILQPKSTLLLQRTYTVEFSQTIHSADGIPLPPNVFFQFTTNSLRRLIYDFPGKGDLAGPLTMLAWGGTQGPVNEVKFDVFASPDSVAVASRQVAPLQQNVFTRLLPSIAWPRGTRIYWAVTSEHVNTHERLSGPVTWFDVIDANAIEDAVGIRPRDHGSKLATNITQLCNSPDLPAGPSYNAALHWSVAAIPANALIVGVKIGLWARTNNVFPSTQPSLYLAQTEWDRCSINTPGPPYPEVNGFLAAATPVDTSQVEFSSDRLGSFFEAMMHNDIYTHGTLVRALSNVTYFSENGADPTKLPYAIIRYVRPGPGPAR